jgi:VCBS repeat-containing protein
MALTDTTKTELYRFFAIAFDAAPGVTYMSQLAAAVDSGMTVLQVVEAFTTKTEFTSVYPNFFTNKQFADKLIENVVGSSANSDAKLEAKEQVESALASGYSRGKVIYQIFSNLSQLSGDAKWGGTATLLNNQVEYAKYFTEVMLGGAEASPDLATLRSVVSNVTTTSATDAASIAAALNPPPVVVNYALTANSPAVTEGDGGTKVLTFVLSLDKIPTSSVVVNYVAAGGTATAGDDYQAVAGAVTFAAGQTTAAVSVVVNADDMDESDETVSVSFTGSSLVNGGVTVTGSIIDDDASPVFTSAEVRSVNEGTAAVGAVTATDADSGSLSFSIAGGADASKFEINVATGALSFRDLPNYEAPGSAASSNAYSVTVRAVDGSGNATTQAITVNVNDVNEAPTAVALTNKAVSIAENTAIATRLKVADIVVTDDALGTNALSLSDTTKFEIVDNALYLKAGTVLDYETQSSLSVVVTAGDASVVGSTPVSTTYTLAVTDVNAAPTAVVLSNTVVSRAENSSSAARVKVADIAVTDDGEGSNALTLSGADSGSFEIDGNALYLKAGVDLNYEAKSSYAVTVNAADSSVAGSSPVSASYTLAVTDVNEAPTAVALTGAVASLAESTSTASRVKVADIAVTDDALGTNTLSLSGEDSGAFEIDGNALYLKAGTALNFESGKTSYAVTVNAADNTVAGSAAVTTSHTVSVTDVNEAPTAVADSASVVVGNTVTINVLANDTDPDTAAAFNTLTLTGVTASAGTATVVGNQVQYVAPNATYVGPVTLTYTMSDGLNTAQGTVNVTVQEPQLTAAAASVNEGQAITYSIMGAPNTEYALQLTSTGMAEIATGIFTVTTNAAGMATLVRTPSADRTTEAGAQSLSAKIIGTQASATVVTVNDTSLDNVAPDTPATTAAAATEGAAVVTGQLVATDADDAASSLTFSTASVVAGFTLNSDGSWSFDPSNAAYNSLAAGDTQALTVNYTVSDNATTSTPGALTDSGVLTITVTGTNDTPTVAAALTAAATEDGAAVVVNLLQGAADVDNGAVLSVADINGTTAGATVTGSTLTVNPAAAEFQNLGAGQTRDIVVTYNVTDGTANVPQTATVTVTGVNDAPVGSAITAQSLTQGVAMAPLNTAAFFTDADQNAVLTYAISGLAVGTGLSFNTTTGVLSGTPNLADRENTAAITVTASDGTASSAAMPLTLTVAPSYTVAASTTTAVNEGASVIYTITSIDGAAAFGRVINYTIQSSTATSDDFDAGLTGQGVFNSNGQVQITIGVKADVLTETAAESFYVDFSVNGATVARAGSAASQVTINDTSVTGDLNRTLTVGADSGANFTLGVGNDTFDGRTNLNSLNTADTLNGGSAGNDTVTGNISVDGGVLVRPTLQNIDVVDITNSDATGGVDTVTVDLANTDADLDTVRSTQSTDTVTFTNVGTVANISAALTAAALNVNYTNAALAGTNAATLSLDNADGITVTVGNSTPLGTNTLETLNVSVVANADATPAMTLAGAGSYVVTSQTDSTVTAYTVNADAGVNASALTKQVIINMTGTGTSTGGNAADSLTGSGVADTLIGGEGNDTILGGAGADDLQGGGGDDRFHFAASADLIAVTGGADAVTDLIDGGTGNNSVRVLAGAIGIGAAGADTLARISNVQTLVGEDAGAVAHAITLASDAAMGSIRTIDLSAGAGASNVALTGVTVAVSVAGGSGVDTITTGAGADSVTGGAGNNVIVTAAGNDQVTLGANIESVNTGADNDVVIAGANLTVADTLVGGAGTDELRLSGVYNLAATSLFSGFETVTLASETDVAGANGGFQYTLAVDNDNDVDAAVTTDTLTVNATALLADADADTAAAQAETLNFTATGTTLYTVSVTGGAANDSLTGGTLADTLVGGAGDDQLTGGAGSDNLQGGEGSDTYFYANTEFVAGDVISDTGTAGTDVLNITSTTDIADAAFANQTGLETLTVNAATNAGVVFTLGTNAQASGIRTVNMDEAGVLAAGAYTVGLTVNDVVATNEVMTTGDGADTFNLNSGNDSIVAGGGNDTVVGGANITNADTLTGGTGTDRLTLDQGAGVGVANSLMTIVFDGDFTQFERINVAAGRDAVSVAGAANDIAGSTNDYTLTLVDANTDAAVTFTVDASALRAGVLTTLGGNEIGDGDDTATDENLSLTATALGATKQLSVIGGAGADTIIGGASADTVQGGGGADEITGNAGADSVSGEGGNDAITGDAGNDTIDGGEGNDTITGGAGVDRITTGNGSDVIRFTAVADSTGADFDTVTDFVSGTDRVSFAFTGTTTDLDVSGFVTVGSFADGLVSLDRSEGDSFYSTADGKLYVDVNGDGQINQGSDYVVSMATVAAAGIDFSITGSGAADTIVGGAGNDTINGGALGDTITGGAGADSIDTGAADDNVRDVITFTSVSDGGAAGAASGYDAISNFDANAGDATDDLIQISGDLRTLLNDNGDASIDYAATDNADGGNQAIVGGAGQEATVLTDAEVEIGLAAFSQVGLADLVAELGEEIDFTAIATGQEHLFVVNFSATQTALVLYTAAAGGDDVITADELRIIGIVTHNDGTGLGGGDVGGP